MDVVVVGAGPAGLAAAVAMERCGLDVAVFDAGAPLQDRRHTVRTQVVSGVGGAGLFSDGKFSFFPSATRLWKLSPGEDVAASNRWLLQALHSIGWVPPATADRATQSGTRARGIDDKRYPSHYASPAARMALTEALAEELGQRVCTRHRVEHVVIRGSEAKPPVLLDVRREGAMTSEPVHARAMVVCTGRFGPVAKRVGFFEDIPELFQRVEIGIRLEQDSSRFLLRDHPSVDPKLIVDLGGGAEMRTFCCCREGEVMVSDFEGIVSVSGRADCPPTGRSNVGLNLRLSGAERVEAEALLARVLAGSLLFDDIAWDQVRAGRRGGVLEDLFGEMYMARFCDGVERLQTLLGHRISDDARVYGAAIEGVGSYPNIGNNLRIMDGRPLWVAGDSSGIFRGLTAAFVSGFFAGLQVCTALLHRRAL